MLKREEKEEIYWAVLKKKVEDRDSDGTKYYADALLKLLANKPKEILE